MAKGAVNRRLSGSARASAQRKRRKVLWFGGLGGSALIGAVVAIIFSATTGRLDGIFQQNSGRSGDLAADFSVTLYQGQRELGAEKLDFSQLRSKPVILNFWAGQCPPCRAEMPDLQSFYEDSKGQVTLIGVDIGPFLNLGSHRDAENLLRELKITYPAGFTNNGSVVRKYGVLGMPTTVFVDSNGEIFRTWTGILNRSTLDGMAQAML